MTSPYRNEIDALKGRKAALEQEVAHVDGMLEDAVRRQKRMLDVIQVASPCAAKWDDMLGDERVRFCLSCEKNVYNLSALPRDEAEQFVQQHAAARSDVCVRFYQRADGTVMTADCPVGQKKKRRKKLALAIAGAGSLAVAAVAALRENQVQGMMSQGEMTMQGAMVAAPPTAPELETPPPTVAEPEAPTAEPEAPTVVPPSAPAHAPERPMMMGRMVRPPTPPAHPGVKTSK